MIGLALCLDLPDNQDMAHARHAHGPLVRALREARSTTLVDLAERADVSVGYLSRVERGERAASVAVTERLATALGVGSGVLSGQFPAMATLRKLVIGNTGTALEEFSRSLDLDVETYVEIENDTLTPTVEQLALIARRLGVDPAVFDVPN
jgi:transcriptional regulator with XRE-family HTH domain